MFIKILFLCFFFVKIYAQKANNRYLVILKKADKYRANEKRQLPEFEYQMSQSDTLRKIRVDFKLDSIAGFGNEISRFINLMNWVHNTFRHDGSNETGITKRNMISIDSVAQEKGIGVSCGELATILNDCYNAMGIYTRKVYCFPLNEDQKDLDSPVSNVVYSHTYKRWIWMDPTNNTYIMNEDGELLGINEVRMSLITGKKLIVNPDANWNRRISQTRENYLFEYMAKNLYQLYSPISNAYPYESSDSAKTIGYIHLLPLHYTKQIPAVYLKKGNFQSSSLQYKRCKIVLEVSNYE